MTSPHLRPVLSLALVLLAAAGPAQAQLTPSAQLGRLFSTPGERSLLDSKRTSTEQPSAYGPPGENGYPGPQPAAAPAAAPAGPAPVLYNGLVRASNGHTTVWLDGAPASQAATSRNGKAVGLRLSSGRRLIMQPGQSYDALSGMVQEGAPAAPAPELPPPDMRQ